MGIVPSYSKTYFTAQQLQIHQRWTPQRYGKIFPMLYRLQAVSPTKEWYLRSKSVQEREPNEIGLSQAPWGKKSNRQAIVPLKNVEACWDSSSVVGCIRIQSIRSEIQSVLRKICLSGSNRFKTGDEVTLCLSSENSVISYGVHAIIGIGLRWYFLEIFRNGFNRISK